MHKRLLLQLSAPRLIQSNNYVPGGISCAADLTAIFRHKISVSAPGRRRLPPQIPGGKRLEPSAACRPCKGQQDKHPLLGKWTKDHQSEVLLPSGGKPWFRFSIYASHVRYGNFSPAKRKSSSASHDIWQRRRAFVMESFCFNYSAIRSDLHGVP